MGNKSIRILLFFVPTLLLVGLLISHTNITQAAPFLSSDDTLGKTAQVASTLTATVQIHSPQNGAYITVHEGTLLSIEGYAWNTYEPPPFPAAPVLEPISNFEGSGTYNVNWSAVPTGNNYVLEEDDNPQFDSPTTYATSSTSEFIAGKPVGTYYYRVRAYNTAGRPSRFSNVESVTVTSASLVGFSLFSQSSALPESPAVENTLLATGTMTVQVQIDGGAWVTATVMDEGDWWSWSYDWPLPEADEVEYPIRARARVDGGEWSDLDTITVTVDNDIFLTYFPLIFRRWPPVPYPPTLSDINNANATGDYTLSWTYGSYEGVPSPTSFTIEEATNANFTTPTEYSVVGSARSHPISNESGGYYYYRVRGVNSYGPGPWSNVESVLVGYYDDFSNANSGWPHGQTYSHDGTEFLYVDYYNGTYRVKVLRNDNGENNRKMAIIKAPYTRTFTNYNVEVEHFFTEAGNAAAEPAQGKASLIFAANDSFSTIYAVEWNYEGHCAVNKYTDVSVPVSAYKDSNLDPHPLKGWGECGAYGVRGGYNNSNPNRFYVEVRDTTARIYAYDEDDVRHLIYQFTEGGLSGKRRTGLVTGSWDHTPVESRFDNYKVVPK
jgi:hypothetical protein